MEKKTGLILFDKLERELSENNHDPRIVAHKFRLTRHETIRAEQELKNLKRLLFRLSK